MGMLNLVLNKDKADERWFHRLPRPYLLQTKADKLWDMLVYVRDSLTLFPAQPHLDQIFILLGLIGNVYASPCFSEEELCQKTQLLEGLISELEPIFSNYRAAVSSPLNATGRMQCTQENCKRYQWKDNVDAYADSNRIRKFLNQLKALGIPAFSSRKYRHACACDNTQMQHRINSIMISLLNQGKERETLHSHCPIEDKEEVGNQWMKLSETTTPFTDLAQELQR